MCGIIGFVDKKRKLSRKDRECILQKMLKEVQYRGYDSTGIFIDENVSIGHNRLSILDTSQKANQPFVRRNKNIIFSYNGEIFNHLELRDITKGYDYATRSDTETFAVVYEKIKDHVFNLIRGMFAVSLYNIANQKILLSVDGFGIKPLYYINTPDWFAWSSEVKVFKYLPEFSFSINKDKLFEYGIFRTTVGPETLFKNVLRVGQGEILKYNIKNDAIENSNYVYKFDDPQLSIERLLDSSISDHILSDVPIGLQLSGGVDSSFISVLVNGLIKQSEIHSFSIGLKDPSWNEF